MTRAFLRFSTSVVLLWSTHQVAAAVHHADLNSANPTPPFTNWATAATVIQDAVDAADAGDEVLVTNGVYATGGRAVFGTMTNRVAVTKPLTLRSVNGPEVTVIEGYQVPGTTNGDGAIRCVYLTDGAVLSGFTLTKGATRTGGPDPELSGGGVRCASTNALVTDCTLTDNSASWSGGGAYRGTLNNCTLTGNSTVYGGGARESTLNNCLLARNSAEYGGGTDGGTLNQCRLTGNSANRNGGGAWRGTLANCMLVGNSASISGGGADTSTLNNCLVTGNTAFWSAGGAGNCTLNHCTLTGNSASGSGGGVGGGTLNNCIVCFNNASAVPNYDSGTFNYCCTTPLPTSGVSNITAEPQLASASHLSANSPCRGAGSAAYAAGVDIDGEHWLSPPSMGCDEYRAGTASGGLTVAIGVAWTNLAVGFSVDMEAQISGQTVTSVWDFGDGTVVSNRPYASHAWAAPGDYAMVLTAYNDSQPEGVSTIVTIRVLTQPVHYVSPGSPSPVPPYTSWATAARTIQDAVDATLLPGALVLVTNGVYAAGGRAVHGTMTNRVVLDRPVVVRSVNGREVTVIQGYQVPGVTNGDGAIRCVYLATGAALSGFTLTSGATRVEGDMYWEASGGGISCQSANAVLVNCAILGNSAAALGGGVYSGTLDNCLLTGNSAGYGGGAFESTLNQCTLTDNSAQYSGGVSGGTLNNCIVYGNTASLNPNYDWSATLNHCCTTPVPTDGTGSITNEPGFVNLVGGDLHLQPASPCINAGSNPYVSGPADLDGNPRIASGTVDIGAYEFQTPTSILSYAWAQQYGLPTDGSADFTDNDADTMNNWQEWRAGTIPTNALSVLRLLTPVSDGTNLTVTWESVAGLSYFLERRPALSSTSSFTRFAADVPGQTNTTSYVDTNAVRANPRFYRVGLE